MPSSWGDCWLRWGPCMHRALVLAKGESAIAKWQCMLLNTVPSNTEQGKTLNPKSLSGNSKLCNQQHQVTQRPGRHAGQLATCPLFFLHALVLTPKGSQARNLVAKPSGKTYSRKTTTVAATACRRHSPCRLTLAKAFSSAQTPPANVKLPRLVACVPQEWAHHLLPPRTG